MEKKQLLIFFPPNKTAYAKIKEEAEDTKEASHRSTTNIFQQKH